MQNDKHANKMHCFPEKNYFYPDQALNVFTKHTSTSYFKPKKKYDGINKSKTVSDEQKWPDNNH